MATAYSTNYSTGGWTYTRLKVDYNYPSTTATATLLYSRTNDWADTATQTWGFSLWVAGSRNPADQNATISTPAFWGRTTDGVVASVDFPVSLSGGRYWGSASATTGLTYFNFDGYVDLPAHTYTIKYDNGYSNQTKTHGTALTLHSSTPTRSNTTANGYTVKFNLNGGSGTTPGDKVQTNTTSYKFAGWYSSVTGKTHGAGASYTGDGDVTLAAQWTSSVSYGSISLPSASKNSTTTSRTVSFDAKTNGGSSNPSNLTSSATVTYSLKGWYTASSGGTKRGGAGDAWTPDGNVTLYAQWNSSTGSYGQITLPSATKNSTTTSRAVTLNATKNGGSCTTTTLTSTATITYPLNGWYSASSGGTKYGDAGGKWTPDTTRTVYAQFGSTTGTYSKVTLPAATKSDGTATRTVTFNGNGGSTPSALKSNATITYTQTGWFTGESGGTNRGKAGDSYTPSSAETLYAQFSSSTGSYSAIELPTPTRTDYVFKGWSTDPDAASGIMGSYTPTSDITLYATWVEDQAKASVKVNGTWVKGKVFYKKDGQWVKVKKVYRKVDGQWKIGRNS